MSSAFPSSSAAPGQATTSTQSPHQPSLIAALKRAHSTANRSPSSSPEEPVAVSTKRARTLSELGEIERAQGELTEWLEQVKLARDTVDSRWREGGDAWTRMARNEARWVRMGCGKARVSDWFELDIPFGDTYSRRLKFAKARLGRLMDARRAVHAPEGLTFPSVPRSSLVTDADLEAFDRIEQVTIEVAKNEDELDEDPATPAPALERELEPEVVAGATEGETEDEEDSQRLQEELVPKRAIPSTAPSEAGRHEESGRSTPRQETQTQLPLERPSPAPPPESDSLRLDPPKSPPALSFSTAAMGGVVPSSSLTLPTVTEPSAAQSAESTAPTPTFASPAAPRPDTPAAPLTSAAPLTAQAPAEKEATPSSSSPYYANRRKFAIPTAKAAPRLEQSAPASSQPVVFGSLWGFQSSATTQPEPITPQPQRQLNAPEPRPQSHPLAQSSRSHPQMPGPQRPPEMLTAAFWPHPVPMGYPLQWRFHDELLPHGLVELLSAAIENLPPEEAFKTMEVLAAKANVHLYRSDGPLNTHVANLFDKVIEHTHRTVSDPNEAVHENARRQHAAAAAHFLLQRNSPSILPQPLIAPSAPLGSDSLQQRPASTGSASSSSALPRPFLVPHPLHCEPAPQPPQRRQRQTTQAQSTLDRAAQLAAKRWKVKQLLLPAKEHFVQLIDWAPTFDNLVKGWEAELTGAAASTRASTSTEASVQTPLARSALAPRASLPRVGPTPPQANVSVAYDGARVTLNRRNEQLVKGWEAIARAERAAALPLVHPSSSTRPSSASAAEVGPSMARAGSAPSRAEEAAREGDVITIDSD